MRIGIIGGGVVGQAIARCYLEHVDEVRVYDVVKERRTHDQTETVETDLVFVCLPETQVDEFFSWAASFWGNRNYVLKSTVPVGTTRKFSQDYGLKNLVHSPEFLTARCAFTDAQIPSRNIVGVPNLLKSDSSHGNKCCTDLLLLLRKRFPGVPVQVMDSSESEAVKLILNGFFATKVSYFNEVYRMCERLNLDWERVRQGVLTDGRIAHAHTKVPGPDGKFGFGGTCLPKDLKQLIDCIEESGVSAPVCRSVLARNMVDRDGPDTRGL